MTGVYNIQIWPQNKLDWQVCSEIAEDQWLKESCSQTKTSKKKKKKASKSVEIIPSILTCWKRRNLAKLVIRQFHHLDFQQIGQLVSSVFAQPAACSLVCNQVLGQPALPQPRVYMAQQLKGWTAHGVCPSCEAQLWTPRLGLTGSHVKKPCSCVWTSTRKKPRRDTGWGRINCCQYHFVIFCKKKKNWKAHRF